MGYEVVFKYADKKEDGKGYDEENIKSYKKNIGKSTEDTPLETLAKSILGQFARRDIWVLDVEVYEFTKKKISFKESKDGIVLKNRKFSYDLASSVIEIEETFENSNEDPPESPIVVANNHHNNIQPEKPTKLKSNLAQVAKPIKKKVLRYEIYDPTPDIAAIAKVKVKNFTVGKKYPIYEEKPASSNIILGMNYLTEDDQGNLRTLNDKHFVPIVNLLDREFETDKSYGNTGNLIQQSDNNYGMKDVYTLGKK